MKKILVTLLFLSLFQGIGIAQTNETQLSEKENYIKQILANDYKFIPSGFFIAITNGNAKYVDLFLKAGMDPNTTYMKVPAICTAICSKQAKIVELLLKAGVDPNKELLGQSPLLYAINRLDSATVDVLIKYGADVNRASNGVYPLNYALRKKDSGIIKSIVNAGAIPNDDALIRAIKTKDENIKTLVLEKYTQKN